MWGFAVSWWVFVSNFVFWTVGWTRDGGGRRHAGLRHTVINIFRHFWPFIDWTTNQYIMKVIIRLIDNSSCCCHRRLVVGDGQTAVQLLSSLCLNLQSVEWGSACLSTSGFHWAAQLRNSPPAACWVWGGGADHEAFRLELMSHLMFTVFSFYHKEQVHHELPVVVSLWDNSMLKVKWVKCLCGALWWQKHELHAMCFHCEPIQLVRDQKQRNRKSAHQLLHGQNMNLYFSDHRVQF